MTTQDKIDTLKTLLQVAKDIQANEILISDCNGLLDKNPEDTVAISWKADAMLRLAMLQVKYEGLLNGLIEEKESVI